MSYRIELIGSYEEGLLDSIKREFREQVEGVSEIYDALYISGYCETYSRERAYFVAYTLAKNEIDFFIE